LKAANEKHQALVARFTGTTFEAKAQEFARLYYRCVQVHCGKQVTLEVARLIIYDWVAACYSDEPILEFPSPLLSPILAMGSVQTSESTQDSFQSFQSMADPPDFSSALLIVAASDAARMAADADDVVGWGPCADEFFDASA
jgi:hypothetical protein